MKSNMLIAVVAVSIIAGFLVGAGSGYLLWHRQFPYGSFQRPPGNFTHINASRMIGTQFSGFPFASSSYLISGNANLSPSGKIATDDFNLTTIPLQNGSILYSMKFDEIGTTYNVTLGQSDKLYWIDTNLADDMKGSDLSIGDDGYVAVNATGYIVAFKYPLPGT
jgi:hypothetical protein